jgi:hypothetical protein
MDVTLSFAGRQLTTREKAEALVDYGLADDMQEALGMLVDMGEADQDAAYVMSCELALAEDEEL